MHFMIVVSSLDNRVATVNRMYCGDSCLAIERDSQSACSLTPKWSKTDYINCEYALLFLHDWFGRDSGSDGSAPREEGSGTKHCYGTHSIRPAFASGRDAFLLLRKNGHGPQPCMAGTVPVKSSRSLVVATACVYYCYCIIVSSLFPSPPPLALVSRATGAYMFRVRGHAVNKEITVTHTRKTCWLVNMLEPPY